MADNYASIEKAKPVAAGMNQFGLKLFQAEISAQPQTNVFVSPLSLYLALAMTEGGAEGKTREAMRQVLGISDQTGDEATTALIETLRAQKGIALSIANAVWSSAPLSAAFVERSKAVYSAEAQSINFDAPEAADTINGWVSDKTSGKIPQIVTPDVVRGSTALLTNAVYFMGRWVTEFNKEATADAEFTLASGEAKKVRMMSRGKLKGAYRQGDGYEAAVLEYRSSEIEMCAILPAEGSTPEQALAKASIEALSEKTAFDLDLKLPKFTLDYETSLKKTLTQMGMGVAFEFPGAEFAPIGSPLFYIGDVLHKTRLEVDEEGTVAAAATVVRVMVGGARPVPQETKVLVFNRPFAVIIADAGTGAVLFEGVVYNP